MTTATRINDACLDAVLDVRASLIGTGHSSVHVASPAEWDVLQGGLYVTGYKPAALDRCAFVTALEGKIEWLR